MKPKKARKAQKLSDREIRRQLLEAVRKGQLRRFVKDGVEYWVNADERQN